MAWEGSLFELLKMFLKRSALLTQNQPLEGCLQRASLKQQGCRWALAVCGERHRGRRVPGISVLTLCGP